MMMQNQRFLLAVFLVAIVVATTLPMASSEEPKAGPLGDPNFFPLAVWLQNPDHAPRYKAAGINTYVGLWRGPTEEQLATLKSHGMYVICSQSAAGLAHKDDPTIIAWMHGDEPDNAQRIRGEKGYGPPILPAKIVEDYKKRKEADPTRPVLLNMGQGVAWDQYIGRGVRRNHPEDYSEYVQGCDIASFDIYPACHEHPDVAGKLWFVPDGVTRLKKWAGPNRPVWNCIECTHISNPEAKATPKQVKAEVWMSLIRGSQGIIYFCHEFKPQNNSAALLADAEMLVGVTAVNKQIQELAAVLNSPTIVEAVTVETSSAETPVEILVKRDANNLYVFAVGMRAGTTTATFKLPASLDATTVHSLGENRTLSIESRQFQDTLRPWDVHLYRIPN